MNFKIITQIITVAFMLMVGQAAAQESSGYKTAVGVRGGWNSGISVKHFISNNAALEGIIGTRYRGVNLTALYELHKGNALGVSRLSWEYGLGASIGTYNGRYYRSWNNKDDYKDRNYTVVSIVGIFGMEYYFAEIPFTIGLDIMPYVDFIGNGNGFIDGSLAFRYVF
jgi:hypothetical protein